MPTTFAIGVLKLRYHLKKTGEEIAGLQTELWQVRSAASPVPRPGDERTNLYTVGA